MKTAIRTLRADCDRLAARVVELEGEIAKDECNSRHCARTKDERDAYAKYIIETTGSMHADLADMLLVGKPPVNKRNGELWIRILETEEERDELRQRLAEEVARRERMTVERNHFAAALGDAAEIMRDSYQTDDVITYAEYQSVSMALDVPSPPADAGESKPSIR